MEGSYTRYIYEPYVGTADFSINNQAAQIHITEVGDFWWHIQLYQNNIALEPGKYKLEFGLGRDNQDPVLNVPYDIQIDKVRLVKLVPVLVTP